MPDPSDPTKPDPTVKPLPPFPPRVPAELWAVMSEQEREQLTEALKGLQAAEDTIAGLYKLRVIEANAIIRMPSDDPNLIEKAKACMDNVDRVREDAKALIALHTARFDKAMWHAMSEFATRQREADRREAAELREKDLAAAAKQARKLAKRSARESEQLAIRRDEDMTLAQHNVAIARRNMWVSLGATIVAVVSLIVSVFK